MRFHRNYHENTFLSNKLIETPHFYDCSTFILPYFVLNMALETCNVLQFYEFYWSQDEKLLLHFFVLLFFLTATKLRRRQRRRCHHRDWKIYERRYHNGTKLTLVRRAATVRMLDLTKLIGSSHSGHHQSQSTKRMNEPADMMNWEKKKRRATTTKNETKETNNKNKSKFNIRDDRAWYKLCTYFGQVECIYTPTFFIVDKQNNWCKVFIWIRRN